MKETTMPTNQELTEQVKQLKKQLEDADKSKQQAVEAVDNQYEAALEGKNEEIAHLKDRIKELNENPSIVRTEDKEEFCNRVWEIVLSSSIEALYRKSIPIVNDISKVKMHMTNALKVADAAREQARLHANHAEKDEQEQANNPLNGLLKS